MLRHATAGLNHESLYAVQFLAARFAGPGGPHVRALNLRVPAPVDARDRRKRRTPIAAAHKSPALRDSRWAAPTSPASDRNAIAIRGRGGLMPQYRQRETRLQTYRRWDLGPKRPTAGSRLAYARSLDVSTRYADLPLDVPAVDSGQSSLLAALQAVASSEHIPLCAPARPFDRGASG